MHWAAFRRYYSRLKDEFDVVVDQVNTIPFLTPLWARVPAVMFIHQLAREVWWYESAFPLNAIGYVCEPLYLRAYRKAPVITVSDSTREDLRKLGFRGSITVVTEGIEAIDSPVGEQTGSPSYIYVGRLTPSKRIGHILQAFSRYRSETGTGTLHVVGSGSQTHQQELLRQAAQLNVSDWVTFHGHLPPSEKNRLMREAHALLLASVREGWGLVVTEANACGTPAIVYDVPGLRDSVRSGVTGLIVRPDPDGLFEAMIRLDTENGLRARLGANAKAWSETFSFDLAASVVRNELQSVVGHTNEALARSWG